MESGASWVAIAFVASPASDSPNMGASSDSDARQRYRDAIECVMASVERWAPEYRRVVVTNEPDLFAELDVETIQRDFLHKPQTRLHDSFNASLYLLDAMAELANRLSDNDGVIFLDPDCLVVRPLIPIMEVARRSGLAGLPINHCESHNINGISRVDAGIVGCRLDGLQRVPTHYGGELYAFTGEGLRRLEPVFERAFHASVDFAASGGLHFTTEEHILSYAIDRLGGAGDLSPFARRIWTSIRHRTASRSDESLVVWHLPAEKTLGFPRLLELAQRKDSWFWAADGSDFISRAASIMGIRRSLGRRGRECLDVLTRRISARILLH